MLHGGFWAASSGTSLAHGLWLAQPWRKSALVPIGTLGPLCAFTTETLRYLGFDACLVVSVYLLVAAALFLVLLGVL